MNASCVTRLASDSNIRNCRGARGKSGLTLIEVVSAVALASLAAIMLYPSFRLANAMIIANRQKMEATALAMDKAMEIFNTYDFQSTTLATSLPAFTPPPDSLLPDNTEIRVMIIPNTGTTVPYKWDVEVRVKRDRFWPGGIRVTLTNDTVFRLTRYDVERN